VSREQQHHDFVAAMGYDLAKRKKMSFHYGANWRRTRAQQAQGPATRPTAISLTIRSKGGGGEGVVSKHSTFQFSYLDLVEFHYGAGVATGV
jgi:hypothetical protein